MENKEHQSTTGISTNETNGLIESLPLTQEHKEELDKAESEEPNETIEEQNAMEIETESTRPETKEERSNEDKESIIFKDVKKEEDVDDNEDEEMKDNDVDSDNYEPEIEIHKPQKEPEPLQEHTDESKTEEAEHEKASESLPKDDDEAENLQKQIPRVDFMRPLKSSAIVGLKPAESYCFPMNRVEQRVWELQNHPRNEVLLRLPYLLKTPIKELKSYPFYDRNFLIYKQGVRPALISSLSILQENTFSHKISLLNEYSHRMDDWQGRLEEMEDQLKKLYPASKRKSSTENSAQIEDENQSNLENNSTFQSSTSRSQPSRRSRHGDTVRSEAEFLEILKNLEMEKEQDPLYRAEQLAAKIPDMILDPVKKSMILMNTNNLVTDKQAWANRMKTDAIDTFTKQEHEKFCEAFLSAPKKFGRISTMMGGLRSAQECVLHYYRTKKSVTDYKQLLAMKKRKSKKGPRGRRGKPKSTVNTSTPNTPLTETPVESGDERELNLENFVPKEAMDEVYTETGRRRRAAAPVFESTHADLVVNENEAKRPLEIDSNAEINSGDLGHTKKKPRGPKPKKAAALAGDTSVLEKEVVTVLPNGSKTTTQFPIINENPEDSKGKTSITSYWSVKDIGLFTKLLAEKGSNWSYIAEQLGTKSTTMVRNYFVRNADAQGWRSVASLADEKNDDRDETVLGVSNQSETLGGDNSNKSSNPIAIAPKNPPLGFFTASSNVPSNISMAPPQVHPRPVFEVLPKVEPISQSSIGSLNAYSTAPPTLPPPPLPQSISSNSGPSFSSSRSNPFSITSLLNPPEESKPEVSKLPIQKPEWESSYNTSSQMNGSTTTSTSCFNPLDALVAAAEDKQSIEPSKPLSSSMGVPSFLGRSILNSNEDDDQTMLPPKPVLPSLGSSNLRNFLNDEEK